MPILILILQIVILVAVVFLLVRKSPAPQQDPRLVQLADTLPAQLTRLDARNQAADEHMRTSFAQMRSDIATEAQRTRGASTADFTILRTEITSSIATLGQALKTDLNSFREDNVVSASNLRSEVVSNITQLGNTLTTELATFGEESAKSAEKLRNDVEQKMHTISQSFADFKNEIGAKHDTLQESLNNKLFELMGSNTTHQDKLRSAVEASLTKLNTDNTTELEKMRQTVDEKLQTTLHERLTQSFGQVTDQLNKVHTGLGEMTKLSDGVNDLSRIFTNVKSRGGFAEVFLDKLLEQVLAPGQYVHNANVRPGTQEVVEYAVRFPGTSGEVLLPIDAKFPREDWERLESAYESGVLEEIEAARKAFDAAIRTEGKRICTKYINEPVTTPYAIMFLPTESLYSEVLRRDGLQAELHQKCRVMVAGPTNLYALLTSFQLGFRMLNLQKKGDEVWKVLGSAQTEFGKFGVLMDKMDKQVSTVQNTIRDLGQRTRTINRTLRDVGEADRALPASQLIDFDQAAGITTFLAASGDDE
jgi:DNA recombination protein RmuC